MLAYLFLLWVEYEAILGTFSGFVGIGTWVERVRVIVDFFY
jgi:hypothetical protein